MAAGALRGWMGGWDVAYGLAFGLKESVCETVWLRSGKPLNPPMFLHVADDEPETEEMERNEGKRHPAGEWDLQESGICNLRFEFSWWDGVHVCGERCLLV